MFTNKSNNTEYLKCKTFSNAFFAGRYSRITMRPESLPTTMKSAKTKTLRQNYSERYKLIVNS